MYIFVLVKFLLVVIPAGANFLSKYALCICLKSMLQQELDNIRVILRDNGYPESIIGRFPTNWLGSSLFQIWP